jgi:hypothetical protein
MSANCKYCRKQPSEIIPGQLPLLSLQRCRHPITQDVAAITDLGATRHRLDLDLAHDLGERVT